jgi:transcriptional regulator with XRE-family HTH domain
MDLEVLARSARSGTGRPRADDIDRHIGARLRQLRIMNGLTVYTLADLIGVTYQQAHKYENGVNRIAAARLYVIARVLGVDVASFFEGLQNDSPSEPTPQQRTFLDLARNFRSIRTRKHQDAICLLTRILAQLESASDSGLWEWETNPRPGRERLAVSD